MHTRVIMAGVVLLLGVAIFAVANRDSQAQPNDAAAVDRSLAEHGQYLVHHVAMCIYCHTPRSADGVLDREQLLQGAPMPVETPFEGRRWAFQAPKLAGLPGGYSEDDLIKFLQTGRTPTGRSPLPPMPPFRMNERDAAAVAAYLQSRQ
jgi:mono/diheme cytochrome c family protein